MRKKREYWGCEMESPLYWEVVKEMSKKGEGKLINEYKTKRGKRSTKYNMEPTPTHEVIIMIGIFVSIWGWIAYTMYKDDNER